LVIRRVAGAQVAVVGWFVLGILSGE